MFMVYQKALILTFHSSFWLQNNFCEFTAPEHKFKRWFCTQKPGVKIRFKDIWHTKINLSQKYILVMRNPYMDSHYCNMFIIIEQKGMTFNHDFAIHSPFLLPSFLRRKRKGKKNNQSRGPKSYLSTRSFVIDSC